MNIGAVRQQECGEQSDENHAVTAMVRAKEGVHSRLVAHVLGVAAAWSYADIDTFSRAMDSRAIGPHQAVSVNLYNPALLVTSTAYLVQSADKRLAILCFRGTEPTNTINWVGDLSARVDPFLSAGKVHGGFLRATMAVWGTLSNLLRCARQGSICEAAINERAKIVDCLAEPQHADAECRPRSGCEQPPTAEPEDKLEALYITGHSLGGAMAVIAAALLYEEDDLNFFQDKLRGIYTFGQPMVGHQDFADRASKDFGSKLFRHVQGNDIFARMPPRSAGPFAHFGAEYTSSEHGWMLQPNPPKAPRWIANTIPIALLEWVQQNVPDVRFLNGIVLPWSVRDHGPIYYLRTSQTIAIGAELM